MYLPYDPAILLLDIYPREMKTCPPKDFANFLSIYSPTSEWVIKYTKTWYIHTMEYYRAITRNELCIRAITWTNLKVKEVRHKPPHILIPFL